MRAAPGPLLMVGLTLVAVAIPERMATGRLAGFTPAAGFAAFVAASLAFAALGRSSSLTVGADSTIAPVIGGAVACGADLRADRLRRWPAGQQRLPVDRSGFGESGPGRPVVSLAEQAGGIADVLETVCGPAKAP